jgi:diguanylate cyclase (GGDEF)-like protein
MSLQKQAIRPPEVIAGEPAGATANIRRAVCIIDERDELLSLSGTLANLGYQVVRVADPRRGGVRLQPAALDAVIIGDGITDPLELAAACSADCPVMLVASDHGFDTRLAAARAGVDAMLAKPLDVSEIADWLEQFAGSRQASPISILVVDDDESLAESYALALESAGMRARVVADPAQALAQMTATFPDLMLMDMQMPAASGIELARIIRQSRRYLSLPIVFLSAERDPMRQLEARKLGGDDFITKPVDLQHLVSLVHMRAERARALRSMMERDSLTGLLNHGRFKDRLAHELERCRRTSAEISLALIDLDHFKRVNDSYGHMSGDQVIRALSHALMAGLRRIDILGRYGGEEFGVILLDTPPAQAGMVIDGLRERFADIAFETDGQAFSSTFSAGIAGSRGRPGVDGLIEAADRALYAAKHAGRNRVVVD